MPPWLGGGHAHDPHERMQGDVVPELIAARPGGGIEGPTEQCLAGQAEPLPGPGGGPPAQVQPYDPAGSR